MAITPFHTIQELLLGLLRSERPGGHPADGVSQTGGQIPLFCLQSRHVSPIPHTHAWWVAGFAGLCSMQELEVFSLNSHVWCCRVGTTWSRGKRSSGVLLSLILVAAAFLLSQLDQTPPLWKSPNQILGQLKYTRNYQPSHSAVSMWQLSLHILFHSHTYSDIDHTHFCVVAVLQSLD